MSILNYNYKRAKEVLTENIDILHELAKPLLARETIYKEEVDMILEGKKTEEIVKIMEEKERKQKEKEARLKTEKENFDKLENYKRKIAEGENLLKMGIITEAELDGIKKWYVEFEKKINAPKEPEAKAEVKEEKKEPEKS